MDPLSIASGAAGLATTCFVVGKAIYGFASDAADVDTNVAGLCDEVTALARVLESISHASARAPQVVAAEIDPEGGLWISVRTTMDDIKRTLDKLDQLIAEIKKGGTFSRGFLRRPTKQIKLNMRLKDVATYQDRIRSYNGAMTTALQMINVCLLMHNNSSQEATLRVLSGLKAQVKRVENALQSNGSYGSFSSTTQDEDKRISNNLEKFVRVAENFHSSASSIVNEGPRSTVWGGSIMGEPLTQQEFTNIERWIPEPIEEEDASTAGPSTTATGSTTLPAEDHHSSDSEDDMEKDLARRLEELAVQNQASGDYPRAEQFFRSAIERGEASKRSPEDLRPLRLELAYACIRQGKWEETGTIITPIAWERKPSDLRAFHILHGLAMAHLKNADLESAEKFGKRALWGKRKLLGKTQPSYCESLALLALIYDARNMAAEAEAHRSFLPPSFQAPSDADACSYLDRSAQMHNILRPQNSSPSLILSDAGDKSSRQNGPAHPREAGAVLHNVGSSSVPQTVLHGGSPPRSLDEYDVEEESGSLPETWRPGMQSKEYRVVDADAPPMKRRIVVCIQYGLKHTDAAYALVGGRDIQEVESMYWPAKGYVGNKVPSVLYRDGDRKVAGWGFHAPDTSPGTGPFTRLDASQALGFAGLMTENGYKKTQFDDDAYDTSETPHDNELGLASPLENANARAVEFSTDFLRRVGDTVLREMGKKYGKISAEDEKHIVWCFCIPSVCISHGQGTRAMVLKSMQQAGFRFEPKDVDHHRLLSEPAASAKGCADLGILELDTIDVILVVQCGADIVEATALKVEEHHPVTVRELTTESGVVIGGWCKSHCEFPEFRRLVADKLADPELHMPFEEGRHIYNTVTKNVLDKFKTDFSLDSDKTGLTVGAGTDIDWGTHTDTGDWGEVVVYDGTMSFTNETLASCWSGIISRVTYLVNEKIEAVRDEGEFLKNIVITGNFATSDYLFSEIKRSIPPEYHSCIIRPDNPFSTALGGLLQAGKESISPQMSYFVDEMQVYREGNHGTWLKVSCPDGVSRVENSLTPILLITDRFQPWAEVRRIRLTRFFEPTEEPMPASRRSIGIYSWSSPFTGLAIRSASRLLGSVEIEAEWLTPQLSKGRFDTPTGTFYKYEFTLYCYINREKGHMAMTLFLDEDESSKILRVRLD